MQISRWLVFCWASATCVGLPQGLIAAPSITNLSLRGLQAGGTTVIAMDGDDLAGDARLLLGAPVTGQSIKPGANSKRAEFEVTLDSQIAPGIYLLRAASTQGVSNAFPVSIDRLRNAPFAAEAGELPVALTGSLNGSTVATTSFAGTRGQRLVIEVESRRLGANLQPTLHLYDARRVQVGWSAGRPSIGGDARIEAVLPADGRYTVELHDALFRGADPGWFRLKIGELAYADLAYPLAITRGPAASLEFAASNFPADMKVAFAPQALDRQPAPWPAGLPLCSGSRPQVLVTAFPEVLESAPTDGLQNVGAAPLGINGRLTAKGQRDQFRLAAAPGQQLRIDVVANRVGSPLDGVLTVLNEHGGQIASNDDRPGTVDPGVDVTVPADSHALTIALADLEGRGGPAFVYRIAVTPVEYPDFALAADEDRWQIPRDQAAVIRIKADRSGYQGPIRLELDPPPPGVTATLAEIPAGASGALLTVSAGAQEPSVWQGRIVGRSVEGPAIEQPLTVAGQPAAKLQPWLSSDLALAVTPPGPLAVDWEAFAPNAQLQAAGSLPVKVRIARAAGVAGAVRVNLVTTQVAPKKTVKVNNQDQSVDDPARALRLDAPLILAADQNEAAGQLLVPVDLAPGVYDVAVEAQLLSADGQQVVARSFAAARRLTAVGPPAEQPLAIFEDQPEFTAALNSGNGQASLTADEKFSGTAALKVTPDQRTADLVPGLSVKIRERPQPGEYRFLQFAWRKQGGQNVCLQLNHDGQWGPIAGNPAKFRYHAGPGPECFGASVSVNGQTPAGFVLVTRDLFADFGEFTLNGLGFSPVDGEFGLFDHIYLGRSPADFDLVKP